MMTLRTLVMAAALVPVAAGASAQVAPPPAPVPAPQVTPAPLALQEHQWTVSGFLGSAFGDAVDEATLDFGGSLNYLWNQSIGAEFMAAFAPSFTIAGAGEANVNTYMANAIAALPLGLEGQWQPYLSGGVGAMNLRNAADVLEAPDQSSWGGNVGLGVMGFMDRWGFRADVRRYSQLGDAGADTLLNDLAFWRGHAGIAYRW